MNVKLKNEKINKEHGLNGRQELSNEQELNDKQILRNSQVLSNAQILNIEKIFEKDLHFLLKNSQKNIERTRAYGYFFTTDYYYYIYNLFIQVPSFNDCDNNFDDSNYCNHFNNLFSVYIKSPSINHKKNAYIPPKTAIVNTKKKIPLSTTIHNEKKFAVAISGGSDSMALLWLAYKFAQKYQYEIIAFTIDHQLRIESNAEAKSMHEFCAKLKIKHEILLWQHEKIESNLEQKARKARYELLIRACQKHKCQNLCVGHTFDDQIETYMIRTISHSKNPGLASINRIREIAYDLNLLRPILRFSRETLRKYLQFYKISWFDDPSNDCDEFLRVRVRKIKNANQIDRKCVREKILGLGKLRNEIETEVVKLLMHGKFFNLAEEIKPYNLESKFFVIIDKNLDKYFDKFLDKFLDENLSKKNDILIDFFKRVIAIVGGKKCYQIIIGENFIDNNTLFSKNATIGNCIIKSTKRYWQLEVENRNLKNEKLKKNLKENLQKNIDQNQNKNVNKNVNQNNSNQNKNDEKIIENKKENINKKLNKKTNKNVNGNPKLTNQMSKCEIEYKYRINYIENLKINKKNYILTGKNINNNIESKGCYNNFLRKILYNIKFRPAGLLDVFCTFDENIDV